MLHGEPVISLDMDVVNEAVATLSNDRVNPPEIQALTGYVERRAP